MHSIKPAAGSRPKKFRVGRGNSSGRGTTAGRGTKGQRARAGGRNKLKLKGIKQMLLSFPKNRGKGFKGRFAKAEIVTLASLSKAYQHPETVSLASLKKAGLISNTAASAKIVSGGEIKVALKVSKGISASKTAAMAIEKAGGKIG